MTIHWHCFGSNGEETADYSRGVLERFTRRALNDWMIPRKNNPENRDAPGNCYVKVIANPRKINFNQSPHQMVYFSDCYVVDENANLSEGSRPLPIVADKIVINHYYIKSREEFLNKVRRGSSARTVMQKKLEWFEQCDRNEEFDDGILKYRDERARVYQPLDKTQDDKRLLDTLIKNIYPTVLTENIFPNNAQDFYAGKMEMFLTCRAVASHLKTKRPDDAVIKFLEEASVSAVIKSFDKMSLADAQLLIRELPNLLNLSYPVIKYLCTYVIEYIPQIKEKLRLNGALREFIGLDYMQDIFNLRE